MISVVRPAGAEPTDGAEHRDPTAAILHDLAVLRRHHERPEAVEQHVAVDALPAALSEGFRDVAGDGPVLVEVLRVGDGLAGAADGGELRRENLVAVQEHRHIISRRRGGARDCFHGGDECGVVESHVRYHEVRRHLRARESGERSEGDREPHRALVLDTFGSHLDAPRSRK
jgi:hypothetical protein